MTEGYPPRKRRVRIFTWVILVINLLFLLWIIIGVAQNSGNATDCGGLSQHTCNGARDAGTAIAVGVIIFLWAAIDVILGIIWLVTRRREPPTVVYVQQAQPSGPPPGWYPSSQNPALMQWWDGFRYTGHTHIARR